MVASRGCQRLGGGQRKTASLRPGEPGKDNVPGQRMAERETGAIGNDQLQRRAPVQRLDDILALDSRSLSQQPPVELAAEYCRGTFHRPLPGIQPGQPRACTSNRSSPRLMLCGRHDPARECRQPSLAKNRLISPRATEPIGVFVAG